MTDRRQLPLPLGPIRNSNFLSNHGLEHRQPLAPEWAAQREQAVGLLDRLGRLWSELRHRVAHYAEAALEQAFIQPVLEALGWTLNCQPALHSMGSYLE